MREQNSQLDIRFQSVNINNSDLKVLKESFKMAVNESEVKRVLQNIVVSSQSKPTVATLRKMYYELKGHDIPFGKLGYNSLSQYLRSIPDVVQIKGVSEYERSLPVTEKNVFGDNSPMKRPKRVRKNATTENLSVIPTQKGINFPIINKKTPNIAQGKKHSKYNNFAIPSTSKSPFIPGGYITNSAFRQALLTGETGAKAKNRDPSPQEVRPKIPRYTPAENEQSTSKPNNFNKSSNLIPKNFLGFGEQVERCVKDFIVGHRIPIVINTICDPSMFWICKENREFDSVQKSMQNEYSRVLRKCVIPEFLLQKGLFCVVYTLNEFHRGLIVKPSTDVGRGYMRVYLIDNGLVQSIYRESIYFLARQFSRLPAQALKVKLAYIEPVKKVWSEESTKRFADFVSGKDILAKIFMTDEEKMAAYISEDCYPSKILNDVLIEEGFATPCKTKITPRKRSDITNLLDLNSTSNSKNSTFSSL